MANSVTLSRMQVLAIPSHMYPMLVLSDGAFSVFSYLIKLRTRGFYNHSMWLTSPGVVASQHLLYKKRSLAPYFKAHRLKFWYNPDWTENDKFAIKSTIASKLEQSWWLRLYDFKGIIGQALGKRLLEWKWAYYCSEGDGEILRVVEPSFNIDKPSPRDLNDWCKANEQMVVFGKYDPDTG